MSHYEVKNNARGFIRRVKRSLISTVPRNEVSVTSMTFNISDWNADRALVASVQTTFTLRGQNMYAKGSVIIYGDAPCAVFKIRTVSPGWITTPDGWEVELSGRTEDVRDTILVHLAEFCGEHFASKAVPV